jgi:hypothetical protein
VKQWASIFGMYTDQYEGKFIQTEWADIGTKWMEKLKDY